MKRFDEIVGHNATVELLRRLLSSRRVPQSMLFRGPEGVGKDSLARLFAAALLCERQAAEACGECGSCLEFERQHHPDFLRVSFEPKPSDGELRKEIVIGQIRDLSRLAGVSPRLGDRRVFVIDPADRMNRESQNALLKTLEEPPGGTHLILVASRPHLLLPTVRSRCFGVGFSILDAGDLAALLERRGIAPPEAALRASLAGGRTGRAIELDLESVTEQREELLGFLEKCAAGSTSAFFELPSLAAEIAARADPELYQSLELLQSVLRDIARIAVGDRAGTIVHSDLADRLSRLTSALGAGAAGRLVETVDRMRGQLRFNVNRKLFAETMLAEIAVAAGAADRVS